MRSRLVLAVRWKREGDAQCGTNAAGGGGGGLFDESVRSNGFFVARQRMSTHIFALNGTRNNHNNNNNPPLSGNASL